MNWFPDKMGALPALDSRTIRAWVEDEAVVSEAIWMDDWLAALPAIAAGTSMPAPVSPPVPDPVDVLIAPVKKMTIGRAKKAAAAHS